MAFEFAKLETCCFRHHFDTLIIFSVAAQSVPGLLKGGSQVQLFPTLMWNNINLCPCIQFETKAVSSMCVVPQFYWDKDLVFRCLSSNFFYMEVTASLRVF